jgi:zinc/manganese transport system substrate-binding protein
MAAVVVEQLAAIRPDARASIGRRAAEARRILRSLDAWAGVQIATIPTQRRVLATPHRAFATFAARYGLKEMALIDAGSGSEQLRPRDLERLRVSLRQEAVPMLFFEGETPPRALRAISARSGVPLAPEPLAADGVLKGQSLVATFVHNTCTVVNGLGGRCDRGGGEALEEAWRRIGIGRSSRLPAGSPSPAQGEPAP